MTMSDPIADTLTRIRNAVRNRAKVVNCLNSKICRGVCDVLRDEGYVDSYDVIDDGRQGKIRVHLRYSEDGEPAIHSLKRYSKPGCRVYRGVEDIDSPLQGMGISIVSTSRGVLSDKRCLEERVGGELLAMVY